MDIKEIKQGQKDWVKTLNDNDKLLNDNRIVIIQDWTKKGVVLENGFTNVGEGMDRAVQWRKLGYADGQTLYTEVFGIVTSNNFTGKETEFAKLPNTVPSRMYPIGGVLHAAGNGNATGYGHVNLSTDGSSTLLTMVGRNPESSGQPIGGWLGFHIIF